MSVMLGQDLQSILGAGAEIVGSGGGVSKLVADTAAGALRAGIDVRMPELAADVVGLTARFALAESGLQARGAAVFAAGEAAPAMATGPAETAPALARPQGLG